MRSNGCAGNCGGSDSNLKNDIADPFLLLRRAAVAAGGDLCAGAVIRGQPVPCAGRASRGVPRTIIISSIPMPSPAVDPPRAHAWGGYSALREDPYPAQWTGVGQIFPKGVRSAPGSLPRPEPLRASKETIARPNARYGFPKSSNRNPRNGSGPFLGRSHLFCAVA